MKAQNHESTSDVESNTIAYYQSHACEYADATRSLNLNDLQTVFLSRLPSRGRILDVGCGSGRDLLAFRQAGFASEGIEPAEKLALLAQEYSGSPVHVGSIQKLDLLDTFDGVWACASLLHLNNEALLVALERIFASLKEEGILLASFKEGIGSRVDEKGRFFQGQTCDSLHDIFAEVGGAEILSCWKTEDVAARGTTWTNVLAQKAA